MDIGDIFKKIKKANRAKVDVKTSGSVQLQSTDETGSIDTTTSNVLNNNKVEDFSNIEPSETLDLNPSVIDNKFILDLPPDLTLNIESLKVLQEDGQEAPEWVKVDPITGQIVAEPPKDVENIKLIFSRKSLGILSRVFPKISPRFRTGTKISNFLSIIFTPI